MHIKNIVVIGGGVVGTAILRELSKYKLNGILLEKQPDVCEGTSKANSGIIHTGFDAPPNSIEAKCLELARTEWPKVVQDLKIPFIPCGAVMVAMTEEEKRIIREKYIPNAALNGVKVNWCEKEELLEMNPGVNENALGGLVIPEEAIADPFWATRSFAEVAVLNGSEVILNAGVTDITPLEEGSFEIMSENGRTIYADYIINAAGLWSDDIARLVGDDSFEITPRKGQFILTEEEVKISQVILPVPTEKSKGALVSPAVFGGFLLGPTAEEQMDKWDRSTNQNGFQFIQEQCEKLVPEVSEYPSIRQFAGVRAVCSEGDFIIRPATAHKNFIHAAGIRSTGLSASLGIAKLVIEQLQNSGLECIEKNDYEKELPKLVDENEDNGEIICLCRSVTKREIVEALNRPVPAMTLDAVKRRTGALLGQCQGNYCIPSIIDLMNANQIVSENIEKGLQGSYLNNKRRERI
ncbi:FAD-dependent oxidoreductase [Sporosarcina sp. CAU 1771]